MKLKFSKKFLALVLAGSTFAIGNKSLVVVGESNNIVMEDINNNYDEMTKDDLVFNVQKYVTAVDNVNIRKKASTDSEIMGLLYEGNSLVMKGLVDNWYKVEYDGSSAYVSADYVKEESKAKVVNDVSKVVYFYDNALMYDDNNFKKSIMDVKKYQTANVYFENSDNYVASISGKVGYIKKQDVKELDGTYVVVDLSDQELNLYQDNKVLLTTPVVTGKPSTPTNEGLFNIFDITTNRYLIGRNNSYRSYVDVMMAFDGGIGLHDAEYHDHYDSNGNVVMHHGWRDISAFGGDTYLYNGSHGCVNMPHDAAMKVYEKVENGTKVLVKE